jgi:hypothetical protein
VKAKSVVADEPVDDVAGVPSKSSTGVVVGVMLAFLAVGGAGGFLFMRAHPAPPEAAAGLAVPATVAPRPVAPPPVVAPVAQPAAIPAAPIPPVIDTPPPNAASAASAKSDAKPERHSRPGAKPPVAAATASASASAAPAPDRPVGGTGVQTEF